MLVKVKLWVKIRGQIIKKWLKLVEIIPRILKSDNYNVAIFHLLYLFLDINLIDLIKVTIFYKR